jgi:hypothetical protein
VKDLPRPRWQVFSWIVSSWADDDNMFSGDIDKLISSFVHCRFVASPVFGPPMAADAGKLVLAMSGDYRSKKEVAYLTVPGVGRKVIDLGGNIEKGASSW